MAKKTKRAAGPTRKASTRVTRKKATKKTVARKPAKRQPAATGELRLSDLRDEINRALKKLDEKAVNDPTRYDKTRMRLASLASDIDDICDPDNPFGCGPVMVFPT